jgi:hypothetical protein
MKKMMSGNLYMFNDGSNIEWVDRETIKYHEKNHYVNIWIDYAAGFFNRGRILKKNTIDYWRKEDGSTEMKISDNERNLIIKKIIDYFANKGVICTIEE